MHYLDQDFPVNHPELPLLIDQLSLWSAPFGKWLLDNVPMQRDLDVLGIDSWVEGINRAIWKVEKMGLKNVELVRGDAAKMPFKDGQFDLVVSNLGINNFDNPPAVLKECHRVLKRNGKICITTNIEGHFREFYMVFESVLKESNLKDSLPLLKADIEHRGNNETIRDLFEQAGFSVLKMLRERSQLRYLDGSAMMHHFLTVVGFLPAWRASIPKEKEREVFGLLEKKLNEQADWDGELKMTVPMLFVEAVK